MPWLVWTKKDAKGAKVVGELPQSVDPAVSEWSNPVTVICHYFYWLSVEGITWGTETSKYPEEKKSNEIP